MNALAAERGFRVYCLLIPPQALYLAARASDRWNTHWSMEAHRTLHSLLREQATFIDLQVEAPLDLDAFADVSRDVNAFGERHFNERGYALVAEAVAERLRRELGAWNSSRPVVPLR